LGVPKFILPEYGPAAAIEAAGVGANGSVEAGSAPTDGVAAISARRLNAGIKSAAIAAAANIFTLNLIVVSCAARRDFKTSQRRIN
jgi:hypothetical protein